MKTIKELWLPVLLGVLLIAALVGVASARPNARPEQQAWRVLTVAIDSCIPAEDHSWWHFPGGLVCMGGVGPCEFICPANFPAAGEQAVGAVNVKRFTMYAYNNDIGTTGGIDAKLQKMYPPTGAYVTMAQAQTYTDMPGMQTIIDTTVVNNPVFRTQSPYVWVEKAQPTLFIGIVLSGFFIHYTW